MGDVSSVLGEGYDVLVARTLRGGATLELVVASQSFLLTKLDDPGARRALLRLWAGAEWSTRRALLARIGEPGHAVLMPELAELAPALDASGRRDVILAIDRIGGVSGEPVLEYLLKTSPMSVRAIAADVLAELGTRFSIQALRYELDHARDPIYEATLFNALDKIEARHPVRANHGSLTLAEDGRGGALTLAGATAGEVTLYERAMEVLARPGAPAQEDAGEGALVVSRGEGLLLGWQGLSPAPRKAPHKLKMYTFTSDHLGFVAFTSSMFSFLTYWIVAGMGPGVPKLLVGASALVSILGPTLTPIVLFLRWKDRHEHLSRFFVEGDYATAKVLSNTHPGVEYVDASGVVRESKLTARQYRRFKMGDKIPVLVEDQELLVLSRLQGVTARADGGIALKLMSPGAVLILCGLFLVILPCVVGFLFALAASF